MDRPRNSARPTRRLVLAGAAAAAVIGLEWSRLRTALAEIVEDVSRLKPGDFTWQPDLSPDGPVAIVVSLTDQLVYVYRNGIRIAVSTCSTGKPGHDTPTGVFTILQKDKHHHSSTYDDAPMPNMERLTWSGVALHAGNLPGYPASHGCVRLPMEFSAKLFEITQIGTPVIIAGAHADPTTVTHPGMVLGEYAEHEFDEAVAKEKNPPTGFTGPVTSIIVSGADKSITVLQNGDTVAFGAATIDDPTQPLGSHVFVLSAADGNKKSLTWHAITHDDGMDLTAADPNDVIKRIHAPHDVVEAIKQRMVAGTVLITTDLPAHPDTRTGKDFVVMTTGEA
jgi:hypothetical protein